MKKIICMKKVLLFLGGLICVFGLSGCSTSMESVMDGADSVLNGLAHGANRVMEGFADGANQTFDSLSDADEGQLKDRVLEKYGAFVDEIGAAALTPEGKLKGTLSKGPDNYTGSYEAIGMNCKARVIPYRAKKGYSKPTQIIRVDQLTADVLSNLWQVTEYVAKHGSIFVKLLVQ